MSVSSYYIEFVGQSAGAAQKSAAKMHLDRVMERKAAALSRLKGFDYFELTPVQRLFVVSYWCPACRLLPLYALNLSHHNKMRCGRCGNVIAFPDKGKYGRLRKKVALAVWHELRDWQDVPQ